MTIEKRRFPVSNLVSMLDWLNLDIAMLEFRIMRYKHPMGYLRRIVPIGLSPNNDNGKERNG